jgi:RNA polymerase sigma factor (sigma-70 family)
MVVQTLADHSDRQLVERALAGHDEAAFQTIVCRHGAMVFRVCWRVLQNPQDAEDAFQATFLVLAQKLRTLRKQASLASWLHGVAQRVALRAKSQAAAQRRREARTCVPELLPADDVTWGELRPVLDRELSRLPDKWRLPLILCYLEGRTQDEAASQLGWSKSTLRRRLEKARDVLGARLKGRGITLPAALSGVLLADCLAAAAPGTELVAATVEATAGVAAGKKAMTAVSATVAGLAEGALKGMLPNKLKTALLLLVIAVLSGSAGLLLRTHANAGGGIEQPTPRETPGPTARAGGERREDMGRPIRSLAGHTNRVTSVAYSPDGRWIATASWDSTARVWDAKTGKEVLRVDSPFTTDYPTVDQIAFSPDSASIVTVMRKSTDTWVVIVWDRRIGDKVRTFPAEGASFALSKGGLIACGGYRVIHLYDLATGKPVREMRDVGEKQLRIVSLTFSPDDRTLISTGHPPTPQRGDGVTRLTIMPDVMRCWDVATGKECPSVLNGRVVGRPHHLHPIALSTDGRSVVHSNRYDISLRETATGGERARLTGHKEDLCDFAFSPDGRTLASGSMDGTVRLWDLRSGKALTRLGKEVDKVSNGGWILSVAFSPDGRTLVSGGLDKKAHIWDVSRITGRQRTVAKRSAADLEADWKDLAGDARKGYAAVGRLVCSPGSAVSFLGKQLESIKPVDDKRIERLIENLDDAQFRVREQASRELEALADRALPALRKALAGKPSLELRRRLDRLLDRLDGDSPSTETLRQIRAVEALESIGSTEARRLLDRLAAGPVDTRLTQEARAAAGRLQRRAPVAR